MLSIIIPSKNEKDVTHMIQSTKKMYPMADVVLIEDYEGKGKGWALRKGLETAEGDVICFIDGDIDIHPGEIHNLLPYLTYYDVVIGIKRLDRLPPRRRIVSFGYRILVRMLFHLHISDTQTGLKLWKRSKIPDWTTDGFAYDIELMVKARKAGLRIKEIPIRCRIYSKVKISSIIKTFWETIRIWIDQK